MITAASVKQRARELGFDLCGIAPAGDLPELPFLSEWLARGYAGEMTYMEKSADARADIRNFLPGARSVIVTGTVYNTAPSGSQDPKTPGPQDPGVQIARYARGQDYHAVLTERLEELVSWMRAHHDQPFDAAIFVDKHHVQERVYARHAGIGWIGKNTCVINPELGSWIFLAGVATSLELAADDPGLDQCGACTICIDACPTGAIVEERVVDATRCISYLTIELHQPIPEEQRAQIGTHAYGCDICQDVCPWNLAPPTTDDPAWRAVPRDGIPAAELWQRSDIELHHMVKGSAMTHLPLSGFRRNLAIVIGNSGNAELAPALDRPGHGVRNAAHSSETPVVRDAVAWAKRQLKAEGERHPPPLAR